MRLIKKPVLCNYYVTYRCNASCSFCDIWEKPSPYITLDNVRANLQDLKRLGVKVIDFTGGEPLLHNQIEDLLRIAKDLGFITTLTTNCLLYPKKAERLSGLIDMLHFSLDYFDAERHNESRGVDCYDFVIDSIQTAKSLGERPDILYTALPNNLEELEPIYQNICLPNDLVCIINPVFAYNEVDVQENLSDSQLTYLSDFGKRRNVYLNDAFIELRRNGGNSTRNPVCKAASSTVVISPKNELVLPCYHLGKKKFPIKNDLYNLFHDSEVEKVRALEGLMPECEGCTINCYMQPSFAVNVNKYFWRALPSTLKYNYLKNTWKQLF